MHVSLAAHCRPQTPQLAGSLCISEHLPLQQTELTQKAPQTPQLRPSVCVFAQKYSSYAGGEYWQQVDMVPQHVIGHFCGTTVAVATPGLCAASRRRTNESALAPSINPPAIIRAKATTSTGTSLPLLAIAVGEWRSLISGCRVLERTGIRLINE